MVDLQKINWLFFPIQSVVLSAVSKNNLKHILKSSGKEISTQADLYWFTLIPRATSSPQKPLGIPLCNQSQITITHMLECMTLN